MLNEYELITKVGRNVLIGYLGIEVETLDRYEQYDAYESNEVGVIIQIVGEMKGQVIITMSMETIKKLISRMMGGIEILKLDEMCWSAFQEFGNWVVSGIATELSTKGIQVNITHPIIQEGKVVFHSRENYVVVPISNELGMMEVCMKLDRAV